MLGECEYSILMPTKSAKEILLRRMFLMKSSKHLGTYDLLGKENQLFSSLNMLFTQKSPVRNKYSRTFDFSLK